MKRKNDPRHQRRIKLMQDLFTYDFNAKAKSEAIQKILDNIEKIDKLIQKAAADRPLTQVNNIDLAILRLATFELIMDKQAPPKVIVDEAVELGKEYGSESSASFINGALGKLIAQTGIST